jgi:hypothetical protein
MPEPDKTPESAPLGKIAGYRLDSLIGAGEAGVLYKALQVSVNRPVALLVLPARLAADGRYVARFLRDARAAGRLQHPNIVSAYQVDKSPDGHYYFAMEYVDGPSLQNLVEREKRLSEKQAVDIILGVARGLAHAEAVGLAHRDITPENILIGLHGMPKLAGFGLARARGGAEGGKGIRGDIRALGAALRYALTGDAGGRRPAPSPPVAAVLRKMTAKDPAKGYESAAALVAALEALQGGKKAGAPRAAQAGPPRRRSKQVVKTARRRAPFPVGLVVVVLVLAAAVAIYAIPRLRKPGPDAAPRDTGSSQQTSPAPAPPWPATREGLLLAWGPGRSHAWSLRGKARYGKSGALLLGGGAALDEGVGTSILRACKKSNALTVEAVLAPADLRQKGPARIVSFSTDGDTRNFTLGQKLEHLVFRLRTPATGENGSRPETVLFRLPSARATHIVVTYEAGLLQCYADGKHVGRSGRVQGDFSNWEPHHFLLGDEHSGSRDWDGRLHAVAVYSRALAPGEVWQNYLRYHAGDVAR